MLTYATTFSGIGGWELGLQASGWKLQWQCERDEFCRAVLKERFGVPIYNDITTICDESPTPVDALIGSPPCQPFSIAGERRGVTDERHLYPAFIRLVGKVKPRWVLMENVPGLLSDNGAFGQYISGLAAVGYDVLWHCIPASYACLRHRRNRVWIIAYSKREGLPRCKPNGGAPCRQTEAQSEFGNEIPRVWNELERIGPHLRGCHGLSVGMVRDQVKALGNAVVPQIPFIIGQAINQIEGIQ